VNEPSDRAATVKSLRFLLNSAALDRPAESSTPIVHLEQRLEQPDGMAWLRSTFERPPFAPMKDAGSRLVAGSLTLAELRALKDRAKAGFSAEQPHEVRLASIAAYFFSIAGALRHHQVCITSQPAAELRVLLVDLAAAVAEPWSSLLSSAAFVEPAK
jgi:hypothetical protein